MTYLRRKLWYVDKDGQHWLEQNDLLARAEPVIVLGEPGMGKSWLLDDLRKADNVAFCRAQQLINQPKPEALLGNNSCLVIDALDEVAAQGRGDAVNLVLQKLGQLDYPQFILSCRVTEWRSAIASGAIADQYDVPPLKVHLESLDRHEQLQLLTDLTGDPVRAGVLLEHFTRFGLDFLGNPQTLKLVSKLSADTLPTTITELFENALETLRKEQNDRRPEQELSRDAALDGAGAAFAGLILSGNARIVDMPSGHIDLADKALPLAEVEAFDSGHVGRAAQPISLRRTRRRA